MFRYIIAVNSAKQGQKPADWWEVKSRHKVDETADEALIKLSRKTREENIHRIFKMRGLLVGQKFKLHWLHDKD